MAEFNQVIKLQNEVAAIEKELIELRANPSPTAQVKVNMKQRELDTRKKTLATLLKNDPSMGKEERAREERVKQKQDASRARVEAPKSKPVDRSPAKTEADDRAKVQQIVQGASGLDKAEIEKRIKQFTDSKEIEYKHKQKQCEEAYQNKVKQNESEWTAKFQQLEQRLRAEYDEKYKTFEHEKTRELENYFMQKNMSTGDRTEVLSLGGSVSRRRNAMEDREKMAENEKLLEQMRGELEQKIREELKIELSSSLKEKESEIAANMKGNFSGQVDELKAENARMQQEVDRVLKENPNIKKVEELEFKYKIELAEQEIDFKNKIKALEQNIAELQEQLKNKPVQEDIQEDSALADSETPAEALQDSEPEEEEIIAAANLEEVENSTEKLLYTRLCEAAKTKLEQEGFDAAREAIYHAAEQGSYEASKIAVQELVKENKIFNLSKLYIFRKSSASHGDKEDFKALAEMEKTNPALMKYEERQIEKKVVIKSDYFSIAMPDSYGGESNPLGCTFKTEDGIEIKCQIAVNVKMPEKLMDRFDKMVDMALKKRHKLYIANSSLIGLYSADFVQNKAGEIEFTIYGNQNRYVFSAKKDTELYNMKFVKSIKKIAMTIMEGSTSYKG